MQNKFTGRKALDCLSDGKIEGVADLIRSIQRFSKEQLKDLADLFDQTLPYTFYDQYKLILVKRAGGNRSVHPSEAKERAFHFGSQIHYLVVQAASRGKKITRKEAINKILKSVGPTPSIKTLERNYDYYRLVLKINKPSPIIKIWPPLIKKKSSPIT